MSREELLRPPELGKNIDNKAIRLWKPEDAGSIFHRLEKQNWAPWLCSPPEVLVTYSRLFPEGQLLITDHKDNPVASLTLNRINWDGNPQTLTTWDAVAGGSVANGDYQRTYAPEGNTLVLMSINVKYQEQGHGYARQLIDKAKETAQILGVEYLISPFRPSEYGKYKSKYRDPGFLEYCRMTDRDGVPIDKWLRNLTRNEMRFLRVAEDSMVVTVSAKKFEELKESYNMGLWKEIAPDVWECGEVGRWHAQRRYATYIEPNLWGEMPIHAKKTVS
jgi:GNAT superfamily N-acetyltransferase